MDAITKTLLTLRTLLLLLRRQYYTDLVQSHPRNSFGNIQSPFAPESISRLLGHRGIASWKFRFHQCSWPWPRRRYDITYPAKGTWIRASTEIRVLENNSKVRRSKYSGLTLQLGFALIMSHKKGSWLQVFATWRLPLKALGGDTTSSSVPTVVQCIRRQATPTFSLNAMAVVLSIATSSALVAGTNPGCTTNSKIS